MKKIFAVLLCLTLLLSLTGCNTLKYIVTPALWSDAEPADFENDYFTITLTTHFEEDELDNLDFAYLSFDVGVYFLAESQTLFDTDMTLEEYANQVLINNDLDATIIEIDGLTCFEFEQAGDDEDFKYFACVFYEDSCYWLVQIAASVDNYDDMYEDILGYASSIEFK